MKNNDFNEHDTCIGSPETNYYYYYYYNKYKKIAVK